MNKKGMIGFREIMEIVNVIFATVATTLIVILCLFFVQTSFDTATTEMEIFANRMIYSLNGISYYDALSDRVYPGVIDWEKLEAGKWQQSMVSGGKGKIGARIELKDTEGKTLVTTYYDEDRYKDLYIYKSQPKEVDYINKKYFVLINGLNIFEAKEALKEAIQEQGEKVFIVQAYERSLERAKSKPEMGQGFLEMEILIEK